MSETVQTARLDGSSAGVSAPVNETRVMSRRRPYPTADEMRTRQKGQRGTPADRLMRRFVVEASGCWRWTGSVTGPGYGHFSINSIYYQAHLLVYILLIGPLPEELEPDHLCRNRWCVNPADIEFVTHAVNSQRGARTVLSPEQVAAIRQARLAGRGVRELAREYGVNHSTVSRLVNGLTWIEQNQMEAAA